MKRLGETSGSYTTSAQVFALSSLLTDKVEEMPSVFLPVGTECVDVQFLYETRSVRLVFLEPSHEREKELIRFSVVRTDLVSTQGVRCFIGGVAGVLVIPNIDVDCALKYEERYLVLWY